MKTDEQLDPNINPAKGVKRLNKLPMIFFIALTAFAALVILFGILSKGNKAANGKEEERGVSMDDASVSQISAQIPEGDIEPSAEVVYRDASGSAKGTRGNDSEMAALVARLEALEARHAAQAEELRQANEAEKLAVANAPLVVDIEGFRSRYSSASGSSGSSGPSGSSDPAGSSNTRDSRDSASFAAYDFPLVLPSLDEEGDGLAKITKGDLEAANGAVNAYRKRAEDGTVIVPFKVQSPVADLELKAGSTIPITMISGINSDLPGDIVAQVNANVFDTRLGDYLLMPMGTRLVGTYESDNVLGVDRVGIVWNRLIFPNGDSLSIESMRGSDTEGYAGLKDKVNNHYGRVFGSALLLSGVSASVSLAGDGGGSGSGQFGPQTAQQTAANEVSLNLGRVITEKLKQDINIEPTIEIRPGMKSIVLVTKDLTFEKPYEQHVDYNKLGHPDFEPEPSYYDPRKGSVMTKTEISK
jgi:type IV secretion system protein VirB10